MFKMPASSGLSLRLSFQSSLPKKRLVSPNKTKRDASVPLSSARAGSTLVVIKKRAARYPFQKVPYLRLMDCGSPPEIDNRVLKRGVRVGLGAEPRIGDDR